MAHTSGPSIDLDFDWPGYGGSPLEGSASQYDFNALMTETFPYPLVPTITTQPSAEANMKLQPSLTRESLSQAPSPLPLRLACPYFKLDPRKHRYCRRYTLRRVKDIKQHILRKHKGRPSCPKCSQTFAPEDQMEHHRKSCQGTAAPTLETRTTREILTQGTTEQQMKELRQYLSRGKPLRDQWYDMWDILFPGEQRPRSVHMDSQSPEPPKRHVAASSLRDLWRDRKSDIMLQAIQELQITFTESHRDAIDKVMESFLDLVDSAAHNTTNMPSSPGAMESFPDRFNSTAENTMDILPRSSVSPAASLDFGTSSSDFAGSCSPMSTYGSLYPASTNFTSSHDPGGLFGPQPFSSSNDRLGIVPQWGTGVGKIFLNILRVHASTFH